MVMPILGMKIIGGVAPILTVGAAGVVTEILLITGCISGMLPVALALLPQKMEIPVSKLEPEYQNLKASHSKPVMLSLRDLGPRPDVFLPGFQGTAH